MAALRWNILVMGRQDNGTWTLARIIRHTQREREREGWGTYTNLVTRLGPQENDMEEEVRERERD